MLAKLKEFAQYLEKEITTELVSQGHVASGKLKESISVEVTKALDLISIDGRFIYYGRYVDTGRRAGVKRVPLDALIEWIRIKRITLNGKSERQVAFAIQTAIYKKGIPTSGDIRKKRFVSGTLEKKESEIISQIRDIVSDFVNIEFENLIEKVQREFNRTAAAA